MAQMRLFAPAETDPPRSLQVETRLNLSHLTWLTLHRRVQFYDSVTGELVEGEIALSYAPADLLLDRHSFITWLDSLGGSAFYPDDYARFVYDAVVSLVSPHEVSLDLRLDYPDGRFDLFLR